MKYMTSEEFQSECSKRFGDDPLQWQFVCPQCKTVQTGQQLIDTGKVSREDVGGFMAFSCIGRFDESQGCNWTLGGLFQIHELEVVIDGDTHRPCFELAEVEVQEAS